MLTPLHRFFDRLFHGHHIAHPTITLPEADTAIPQRQGIPDAYLDKLPPAEERAGDRYYARDPISHCFSEMADPHDHAAHH